LTLVSCTETEHAEKGIGKKDITGYSDTGFYSTDGVCAFTAQNRNQVAVNTKRLTYRLQNPDQSQYVHVKFVEKPEAVGQKVKVSFTFQGISFLKGETEEMEVVRVDEGKVWLSGDNAGIIIPFF
jgi:hypothetical protein